MYGTGTTEGYGTGTEASGDGGWRLNVEDDERGSIGGIGCRGSELEVGECPTQCVHALLAAINGHQHAIKVSTTRHHRFVSHSLSVFDSCYQFIAFYLLLLQLVQVWSYY